MGRDDHLEKIIVSGQQTLSGEVAISGAKNAVLPIIVATLLTEDQCTLYDVPRLADVQTISEVLQSLGAKVDYQGHTMVIEGADVSKTEAPYEYVQKMRASVLIMGPLLARFGRVNLSMPGGCAIGTRPIDLHLKGLELLGATIHIDEDGVHAESNGRLHGNDIFLRVPSVGATENIMMAAALAEGVTRIENAAEEPEIVDLANMLNAMGAEVRGAGTSMIRITGVDRLHGASHTIIPDRIEAGSYLLAGAITKSRIKVTNCIADHLRPVLEKLEESGAKVLIDAEAMTVEVVGGAHIRPVNIKTLPYPGFPTDMQSQFMAYMCLAEGTANFTETIFENRFMHVDELRKMGANIQLDGKNAFVTGIPMFYGADVKATDLRAGAALIIAALAAEGETTISQLHHLDRGYEDLIGKFKQLGAKIERVDQ
ncbi:UDP-N-acetylglucosamine 1-carboxyvinyltransferase [Peptococcus simiae]|uniref:UDP-N-acetylglucosamine 1-carboxyvinyltransferase n=1 Tax=Peptococcus simiae TaxID=1643805 RepID=UPI003980C434